jgi:type IV secretory pathway VirB4 component
MINATTRQGDELANLLDWWGIVGHTPGILSTKSDRLLMTFAARCQDTEQMAPDERSWYFGRLDSVLRMLEPGWTLEADWWHEPVIVYPTTPWQTYYGPRSDQYVDALRREDVERHPRFMSWLYLTLTWRPPAPTRQFLATLFRTQGSTQQAYRTLLDDVARFQEGLARLAGFLAPLCDDLTPLDADQLCTYLHQTVSWDRHRITCPDPATDLDWQLTSEVWVPGQPSKLGPVLLQPITIKTWRPQLRTTLPEALSMLSFPCRYHVRWTPMSAPAADHFLKWAEKRWAGSYRGLGKLLKSSAGVDEATEVIGREDQEGAITAGQSLIDMRKLVQRGLAIVGQLDATVLCWGETPEILDARVQGVTEALFPQGLIARVEQAHASTAWLSTLPGQGAYALRGRVLATPHLTALMPHTTLWHGPVRDPHWGDPLLMASTDGGVFRVVTHVGELGHVLLPGPSRWGKSGLMGLMLCQAFRYAKLRACVFDRDYAHKALTLLRRGQHYDLGTSTCPPLHILADLETEDQQQWATIWIEHMLVGEGLAPTPEERREIWQMIQLLAALPRAHRTLTRARQLLQVTRLKVGFAPFCVGGEYAFCDGSTDTIGWDTTLICFEMAGLINKPRALRAVLSYCFHQLETRWFTGDPVVIAVDEAKWLLSITAFLGEFEVWLKARAKKNVSVWVATQELYDLYTTDAWQAIMANMLVKIMTPNPMVLSPDVRTLYQAMGVTEHSLHRLATGQRYRDYLYVSPEGQRMFQCTLSPVERALCAASRPEELAVLAKLVMEVTPEALPGVWLRHWGYPEAAAVLDQSDEERNDQCFVPSVDLALV